MGMKILVVNPNTTVSMTEKIGAVARQAVGPDVSIITETSHEGPASIQGYLDIANSFSGLHAAVHRHPGADAVVVACFDDTGVDALRCVTEVPVLGIGEAAFHVAAMTATRFSVVTTLARSVPGIEDNLQRYGLAARCRRVRASNVPVLALENGDPACTDRIRAEIRAAIDEDGAETIVLGCAGMADLMAMLSDEFAIPVIDGVAAGAALAGALVRMQAKTSKIGAYALN